MTTHTLISVATYNDTTMTNIGVNYIPEVLVEIVNKNIYRNLKILTKTGNFICDETQSYAYGGVGCGDNSCIFYKNPDDCELKLLKHYDGSSYVVEINVNLKFENNTEFMCMLNDIKNIDMLNLDIFIKLCDEYIQKNLTILPKNEEESNDD